MQSSLAAWTSFASGPLVYLISHGCYCTASILLTQHVGTSARRSLDQCWIQGIQIRGP